MQNQLFYGDNLDILRKFIADQSVDLCYIDPPFNSDANYNQTYSTKAKTDQAQSQAFVDTWTWDFAAKEGLNEILNNQSGAVTREMGKLYVGLSEMLGESPLLAYLISMGNRILEIWRVLKPTGSFYLHCDPTASHYLKLVLDAVFVSKGGKFMNEIIWCYKTGGRSKNFFPRKHDTIFWYAKSKNYHFYYDQIALPRNTDTMHEPVLEDEEGRLYQKNVKNGTEYRYYLDKGVLPNDYWVDLQAINPSAKERLGYPTQKPEALLERIIKASSKEGDVVLDGYCGCGTTIAVAEKLGRKWIGIDITYQSISLIIKRLEDTFGKDFSQEIIDKNTQEVLPAKVILTGIPKDLDSFRALANKKDDRLRKEIEKLLILRYSNNRAMINDKKGADKGIDGTAFIWHNADKEIKEVIFSVKTGNPNIQHIRELHSVVEREKAAVGILISLENVTKNMYQEAKKLGEYENELLNLKLDRLQIITAQDIIDGKRFALPIALEVIKKAERKVGKSNNKGFFDK